MARKKTRRQTRRERRSLRETSRKDESNTSLAEDSTKRHSRDKGKRKETTPTVSVEEKTRHSCETITTENPTQQEKRKPKPPKPVPPAVEKAVADFMKFTTETAGVEGLRQECKIVLDCKPNPGTYTKFEALPQFNRYPEVPCLDETRIKVQPIDEGDNDYIHANRVKMENCEREYILTQGPKANTIEDFWKMVFQQQCPGVVMLCNFYEEGVQACEEFWPTEAGAYKYYGKMFVNNKRVDHLDQYDVYVLEILPDGCSNSILTRLAHCNTWPKKAVPSSGRMVLRLIRWTQSLEPGPVTVLCSAGVGRTGTFIAIDFACTRLFKGFDGNIKDIVLAIRRQRAYSIHNELQYFFVYSTVLDYIRAKISKYHKQVSKFYAELTKV